MEDSQKEGLFDAFQATAGKLVDYMMLVELEHGKDPLLAADISMLGVLLTFMRAALEDPEWGKQVTDILWPDRGMVHQFTAIIRDKIRP